MKRLFICSPYRGDVEKNIAIAKRISRLAFQNGYAPFAPHLYYPTFLDDELPVERAYGIEAAKVWMNCAEKMWIYGRFGITEGMQGEINYATSIALPRGRSKRTSLDGRHPANRRRRPMDGSRRASPCRRIPRR